MSDLISREEFERRIKPYDTDDPMDKALYNFAHNKMIDCPSAEPERKHGHWIMQNDRSKKLFGWLFCSECNAWIGEPTDYCSNCGADMREADG